MSKKAEKIEVTEGSGNVFADLGCANPEELKLKAKIASSINSILKHRGITQAQAARVLGINQPDVSNLKRGNLKHFTVERLFEHLNSLGRDVEIRIKKKNPRTKREPHIQVVAA
ncbi:MAG: helix-turn-helix domain-containing protein [Gammaproteobacteria bacterium]|nr:helix-turn-helix domain-containing protein [Gammaproteobacteria bacterium]MDH5729262.1 helix-turn-helix domain-containing protein [Gammaproteobacteria bacterium]